MLCCASVAHVRGAVWAFLSSFIPFTTDKDWTLVANYWLLFYIGAIRCVLCSLGTNSMFSSKSVVFASFVTFAAYKLLNLDSTSVKTLQSSVLIMLLGRHAVFNPGLTNSCWL